MARSELIVVAGAGSVGCFVGGLLADAGRDVALLARPRIRDEIARHGLRLTSLDGLDRAVAAGRVAVSDDAALLAGAGVVLVTVKSADTAAMAEAIATGVASDAVIVSLQNGVGNVALLRSRLPGHRVLAAMVPFNVVAMGGGRFHRATSGDIVIERDHADTAALLSAPALTLRPSDRIEGVQYGKLLLNLNNALNALSDLPLREQLAHRAWRRLFAAEIAEGLAALRAARITPISATPIPAALMPHLLRLPDKWFQLLLGRSLRIDPHARSSMWDDLARKRTTEVDFLQGVVVELAQRHGIDAPLSRRVAALVKDAEARGQGSPGLTPEQVAIPAMRR